MIPVSFQSNKLISKFLASIIEELLIRIEIASTDKAVGRGMEISLGTSHVVKSGTITTYARFVPLAIVVLSE